MGNSSECIGALMAKLHFTANIQRHVECPTADVPGDDVRSVLDRFFETNPMARSYILDDQAGVRKHITIFVDGQAIRDRVRLSDRVTPSSSVYVFQALSGG
jgi:molybdopterin synthase sulfur carrier subunit